MSAHVRDTPDSGSSLVDWREAWKLTRADTPGNLGQGNPAVTVKEIEDFAKRCTCAAK